jgi:hypothetical protein
VPVEYGEFPDVLQPLVSLGTGGATLFGSFTNKRGRKIFHRGGVGVACPASYVMAPFSRAFGRQSNHKATRGMGVNVLSEANYWLLARRRTGAETATEDSSIVYEVCLCSRESNGNGTGRQPPLAGRWVCGHCVGVTLL